MDLVKEDQEKLREAASIGDALAVKELVDKGVDVNSRNGMNGWTALHWSSKRGHENIVSCLIAYGADKNVKNKDGNAPCEVASSDRIRIMLGGEPGSGEGKPKDNLPITPNYLSNPPFPYISGSSNFRQPENHASLPPSHKHSSHTPQPSDTQARNGTSRTPVPDENELVLKVRVADTTQKDFIEIEVERNRLTFQYVLSIICRELNVNPSHVTRLRKLPNTIVRKDKDVGRFLDFQELEVVLNNGGSSDSYSPRHVDVVY